MLIKAPSLPPLFLSTLGFRNVSVKKHNTTISEFSEMPSILSSNFMLPMVQKEREIQLISSFLNQSSCLDPFHSSSGSSVCSPPDSCTDVCCSGCNASQLQCDQLVPGINNATLKLVCNGSVANCKHVTLHLLQSISTMKKTDQNLLHKHGQREHCLNNQLVNIKLLQEQKARKMGKLVVELGH